MNRKFNYTHLRIFEKTGIEIPLNFDAYCNIVFPNKYGENSVFYPITDVSANIIDYYKKYSGNRYTTDEIVNGHGKYIATSLDGTSTGSAPIIYSETINNLSQEDESYKEYAINSIDSAYIFSGTLGFPSVTFNTKLAFDEVSTDLVETQTLYILTDSCKKLNPTETADTEIVKVSDSTTIGVQQWRIRYKLLFFIDNRENTNFRFFTVNNDEVVWTDKIILDLNNPNEYKVNIGFTSSEEGIYEQSMYICLLDTGNNGNIPYESADIYPIGQITLNAESIGEDERYRTLFTNFGIPDPIRYHSVFNNVDNLEDNIDWRILNENSKKLFLSYAEIFPYAGSYKGLINAIKTLGYDDIFFKEWYKNLGQTTYNNTYIAYDMTYKSDLNANVISNLSMEEKIQLKKLNWLSMMYHINEETKSAQDKFGFPEVVNKYGYNDNTFIVKLIALREWLQKYIVGLNCRIVDIGGEGIYFERYRLASFGSHQQVLEWNNIHNLTPFVITDNDYILRNNEANININVGTEDLYLTLEDIKGTTIADYCDGYIDLNTNVYHLFNINNYDINNNYLYTGQTLESISNFNTFEIKASCKTDSFIFNDSFLDSSSCTLLVYDNKIQINPYDIAKNVNNISSFKILPIIYLEKSTLTSDSSNYTYSIIPNEIGDGSYKIILPDDSSIIVNDYVTLIPMNTSSKFEYSFNRTLNKYVIHIQNYKIKTNTGYINLNNKFILNIIDGKCVFNDHEYDREIYLNFNYDLNATEQNISVNSIYHSDEFTIKYYKTSNNEDDKFYYLLPGNVYNDFINYYNQCIYTGEDGAVNYNFIHPIKVNNTGKFIVDVYAKDAHNNIFAKACTEYAYVGMPSIKLTTYSKNSTSNNEFNISGEIIDSSEKDILSNKFIDYCIFDNSDLNTIEQVNNNENRPYIKYDNLSYNANAGNDATYVNILNLGDRFYLEDIESFNLTSGPGSTLYNGYYMTLNSYTYKNRYLSLDSSNDVLAMKKETGNSEYDPEDPGPINELLDTIVSNTNRTGYSNVDVIIFNELGKYPIAQLPGVMLKSGDNDFNLCINDTSKSSYAWQKVSSSIGNKVINSSVNIDGIVHKIAAIRHGQNCKYYVKTNKNFDGVTDSTNLYTADNVFPNLINLLNNKYVSIYIIPTWKVPVKLIIDSENRPVLQPFIYNEFPLNGYLNNNSLIKLIYESNILSYKAQSSHKIINANISANEYTLSGSINPEYAVKIGNYIVVELPADDSTKHPLHEIYLKLYELAPDPYEGQTIIVKDYMEGNPPEITCIYLKFNNIPGWKYVIRYKENNTYKNIYGPDNSTSLISLYLSPAHHAYVNYKISGHILESNNNSNYSIINVDKNNVSRKILDFIDTSTFVLNTKNFDTNNGIKFWMDSYSTNNIKTYPNIIKDNRPIYKYESCPVSIYTNENDVIIKINYNNSNIDENTSYVLWKIYKVIDNNSTLLFESYNEVLYLDGNEKGLYDIIANVFDKHGNLSINTFKGQIKII